MQCDVDAAGESLDCQIRRASLADLRGAAVAVGDEIAAVSPEEIRCALRNMSPDQFRTIAEALLERPSLLARSLRRLSHGQLLGAAPQRGEDRVLAQRREAFAAAAGELLRFDDDCSPPARLVAQCIDEHTRLELRQRRRQQLRAEREAAQQATSPVPAPRPIPPTPVATPTPESPAPRPQPRPASWRLPPAGGPQPSGGGHPGSRPVSVLSFAAPPAAAKVGAAAPAPAPAPAPQPPPSAPAGAPSRIPAETVAEALGVEHAPAMLREGDVVVVHCPAGMFQPDTAPGTVIGHARGRVGVLLDSGETRGVALSDLVQDGEDTLAHWRKVFPEGTRVEILDKPTGGSPFSGREGVVTGTARGRVGVQVEGPEGPETHGFTEQQLRPAADGDGDDDPAELLAFYPRGSKVLIDDRTGEFARGHHGEQGTVVGSARGRVGVMLDASGGILGLGPPQLVAQRPDSDEEDPDLGGRWPVGTRVTVCDPPIGGKLDGCRGTVAAGSGRGRMSVRLDSGELVGVVPQSLRHIEEDDDENGGWLVHLFPLGSRCHMLLRGPEELDGRCGVVCRAPEGSPQGTVAVAFEDSTTRCVPPELLIRVHSS